MIHARVEGRIGRITLDRSRALNALSLDMISGMRRALADWEIDAGVDAVVVDSAHERAFCAGGDVRAVRELAVHGRYEEAEAFFSLEYALDYAIARFPKPYVALIDGMAFGGGLGISVHGRFRVVTEHAVMSMPETAIGFFPDVGGTYFLPRLAGHVGMYLGLSGARVHGAEAVRVGLATHYVPRARLAELRAALVAEGVPAVERFAEDVALRSGSATGGGGTGYTGGAGHVGSAGHAGESKTSAAHGLPFEVIERCFGGESLRAIWTCLQAEGRTDLLESAAPSALRVTFDLLRAGARSSLEQCFARELETASRLLRSHDFAEGVRAALVHKDRKPRWYPARVEEVL